MKMLFIKHFFVDVWFLRYREYPYSGTVRIRLLSPNSGGDTPPYHAPPPHPTSNIRRLRVVYPSPYILSISMLKTYDSVTLPPPHVTNRCRGGGHIAHTHTCGRCTTRK